MKRPEGLSPAFGSLVSPYVPNSMVFEWEFRGTGNERHTSAQLEWYEEGVLKASRTALTESYVFLGTEFALEEGGSYEWRVRTQSNLGQWSAWTELHAFEYGGIDIQPSLAWVEEAVSGEEVKRDEALLEIKNNLILLVNDYIGQGSDVDEINALEMIDEMLTGQVVPSRKDFESMKTVVNMIATKKEVMSPFDVIGPFRNGLGARDIQLIRGFLLAIQMNPPQAPRSARIVIDPTTVQAITLVTGEVDGALDKDINVKWEWEEYEPSRGRVYLDSLSVSEDINYYELVLSYGVDGEGIDHQLFFTKEMIDTQGGFFQFYTDWANVFDKTNITSAKHRISVRAVDKRGNMSTWYRNVIQHSGANNIPLGRWYQELQYQRETDKSTTWWKVDGKTVFYGETYEHFLGDKNYKVRYRVRTVDKSGLMSDWEVSEWVDFEGLVPPGPPRNLKSSSITNTGFKVSWESGKNATNYQIKIMSTGTAYYTGGEKTYTTSNRKANTKYWFYVRSTNAVGTSSWVSIAVTTKPEPTTSEEYSFSGGSSWRTSYKSYSSMVPGGWRTSLKWVYQGRWEYQENTQDDWDMDGDNEQVYKGMHNGNHKGLWFIDYAKIRRDVGNKKIKKAEIYIQRASTQHGYPNDATPVYLWLHNYTSRPSGEPTIFNEVATNVRLDRGEGKWITIPNWMMQKIVDGSARGFAVHKKKVGTANDVSYQYFSNKIKVRITYG